MDLNRYTVQNWNIGFEKNENDNGRQSIILFASFILCTGELAAEADALDNDA